MWARFYSTKPDDSCPKSKEAQLKWSGWIRQVHRWLAILFTLSVIGNFIAMALGRPSPWITYSPLLPLFLLIFTGLYMFALPYAAEWREKRQPT
jgi:heme A synthase